MTTQYTSILKLALPVQGELSGTWGDVVNDNITSMVEEAVAGRAVIDTWTTNSHTLTTADGTTSEARCAMLEFTDTGAALTGAATVVCPSASKLYVCKNDSGQQVTIQTAAGTGVAIPDGETMFVFCDGTNVEQCETNFNSLSYNGYTLNFGGAVTTAGAFTTSGAYALTLTTTGATDVTLPTTGTLATLDGTETLTNKTLTAPSISSPSLTGSISATDLTISGNTTIGDASADTLTVNSTITSNLIFTDDTYDIGATGATRPRNLFLSGNATIGGTVTLSGGIDVTGALGVDGDFDVNTDKFTVASATGNTVVAGTLGVTGITTATGGLNADTISEITAAGGVTVDGVLLKDGGATVTADINFGDDDKAIFGDSSEFQIYHASVTDASFITETGSGGLFLQAENVILENTTGDNYFLGVNGGASTVYFSGAAKLATTNTGIDVTGEVIADESIRVEGTTAPAFTAFNSTNNSSRSGEIQFLEGGTGVWGAADVYGFRWLYNGDTNAFKLDRLENTTETQVMGVARGTGLVKFYNSTGDDFVTFDAASEQVTITSSAVSSNVRIISDDAGTTSAPDLTLYRNSATPADNDTLGILYFAGNDSNANEINYGAVYGVLADTTAGTQDGTVVIATRSGGTQTDILTVGPTDVTSNVNFAVNQTSVDGTSGLRSNINDGGGEYSLLFTSPGQSNLYAGSASTENNSLGIFTANTGTEAQVAKFMGGSTQGSLVVGNSFTPTNYDMFTAHSDTAGVGINLSNYNTGGNSWRILSGSNTSSLLAGALGFYSGNSAGYKMHFSEDGNLGIGVNAGTEPDAMLHIERSGTANLDGLIVNNFNAGTSNTANFYLAVNGGSDVTSGSQNGMTKLTTSRSSDGSGDFLITLSGGSATENQVAWFNGSQEQFLIGDSSPSTYVNFTTAGHPRFEIDGDDFYESMAMVGRWQNSGSGPSYSGFKSRGSYGTQTLVQTGDELLKINAFGSNGSTAKSAGQLLFLAGATPGTGDDMPGDFSIKLSENGSAVGAQRFFIDSEGNVGLNTTDPDDGLVIVGDADIRLDISSSTGETAAEIKYSYDGTQKGLFAYNTSSQRFEFSDDTDKMMELDQGHLILNSRGTEPMRFDMVGTDTNISSEIRMMETNGSLGFVLRYEGVSTNDFTISSGTIGSQVTALTIARGSSNVAIAGALSKGSGSFKIDHPLPAKRETHHLVHSFLEGPKADLIYRGRVDLVDGVASVNVDTAAGMTDGTFVLLCQDVQCFTSNETGWTAVKGSVSGNTLTITAQDNTCTDTISWMVVGERADQHMLDTDWTDAEGHVIVEPAKVTATPEGG